MDDGGSTVVVSSGDTLEVVLPQNASTGYRWELELADGLTVVEDRHLPPSPERPGAAGCRLFVLRVHEPGILRARLRRPWEPVEAVAQSYTVCVRTA
nr:protease inhibitor I42 family protein [Planosporangium thailandense]